MRASKEFPNYLVGRDGTVRNKTTLKLLTPVVDYTARRGYEKIYIKDLNGNNKNIRIHQLVAEVYLGYERLGGKEINSHTLVVDHIDNNKLNNHVNNLRLIPHYHNISKSAPIGKAGYRGLQYNEKADCYYLRLTFLGSKYMLDKCYPNDDLENYSIMWITANYYMKELEAEVINEQNKLIEEAKTELNSITV